MEYRRISTDVRLKGFLTTVFSFENLNLKVTYDMDARPYERVSNVLVLCQESNDCKSAEYVELDDAMEYCVITSSWTAGGGDAFEMIRDEKINQTSLGPDIGMVKFITVKPYKLFHII